MQWRLLFVWVTICFIVRSLVFFLSFLFIWFIFILLSYIFCSDKLGWIQFFQNFCSCACDFDFLLFLFSWFILILLSYVFYCHKFGVKLVLPKPTNSARHCNLWSCKCSCNPFDSEKVHLIKSIDQKLNSEFKTVQEMCGNVRRTVAQNRWWSNMNQKPEQLEWLRPSSGRYIAFCSYESHFAVAPAGTVYYYYC